MKNLINKNATSKVNDVLGSRNFFVSLFTIFMLIFQFNGSEVTDPTATSGEIYDALKNGSFLPIVMTLFPNVINPIIKMVRNGFNSGFVKSLNFWVQTGTVILLVVGGYGIVFPEGAAAQVVQAIFAGDTGLIITVISANIINPLWHFFFDRRKEIGSPSRLNVI